MRLSIRWKLLLSVFLPSVFVSILVVSLVLSEVSPATLEQWTVGARLSPLWAILILAGLLAGLLLGMGVYLERSVSKVTRAVRQLGQGDFGARVETSIGADELGNLARTFNIAAGELGLRFEELSRATSAGQEVEGELRAARKIQASLLPHQFPDDHRFQLFGVNSPAEHVGGDFFDYYCTADDEIFLVIADVSGKGTPAAILMAVSRTIIHSLAMAGLAPATILKEANRALVDNQIGTMYVTLFVAKYVPSTGEYTYANGAHLPPLHVSVDAQVSTVGAATGTLVGIFPDAEFEQGRGRLERGELLLLYTDGVTEARSPLGEFYGDAPVTRLLSGYSDAPPHFLCDLIVREVNAFQGGDPADDLTLLMLRRVH